MHTKRKHLAIAIAVAMLAGGFALAAPAAAHDLDPKDKTHKKKKTSSNDVPLWSGDKPVYVGLGIGDSIVLCADGSTPGQVAVDNPENGNNLVTQSVPEPKTDLCLGGALDVIYEDEDESSTQATPPTLPSSWQIWLTDWVQNTGTQQGGPGTPGLWDLTGNEELPIAAFANLQVKIHQHDLSGKARSCTDPGTSGGTQVCLEDPDADVKKVYQAAQFGICGKGGTDSVGTGSPTLSDVTDGEDDHYIVEKVVFVDGPIFYAFDCAFSSGGSIASLYNTMRSIVNSSPVCTDINVCLFPFPATPAKCWVAGDTKEPTAWSTEAKHQIGGQPIPGMGVIGTVGWNHDSIVNNEGCEENPNTALTTNGQGITPDVEIENFPVTLTSQNDNYGRVTFPQPCGSNDNGDNRLLCTQ